MKPIPKKSIWKVAIGVMAAVFLPLSQAHAGLGDLFGIASITGGAIQTVAMVINLIIGFIGGVAFQLGGFFVEWALKLNNTILDSSQNFFLYTGWGIMLNIANLLLIVAMIVIAFSTILRFESYGMKKTLWRLIIVALLINFSLLFVGILVDIAGELTQFFLTQSQLGGGVTGTSNFSAALAGAFHISSFFKVASHNADLNGVGSATTLANGTFIVIGSVFFTTIFSVVAAIVMFALAFMLVARYVMLSFLLMFSPIIWVSWILPNTRKHWSKWWDEVIRWTFFAPIVIFMVWLSLLSITKSGEALKSTGSAFSTSTQALGQVDQALSKNFTFGLEGLTGMAMATFLLMSSLIMANKFSISGAKAANGMATGFINNTKNWAGRKARGGYARTVGAPAGKVAEKIQQAGARIGASRIPGAKLAGYGVLQTGRGAEKITAGVGAGLIKEEEKRQQGKSARELALEASTMTQAQLAAALPKILKEGEVYSMDKTFRDQLLTAGNTEAAFKRMLGDKKGGDLFGDYQKGYGANAEMVVKMNEVRPQVAALDKKLEDKQKEVDTATGFTKMSKQAELVTLKEDIRKQKDELLKEYATASDKFYDKFSRKNFEDILTTKAFKESPYYDAAFKSMLLDEPGAIGKLASKADSKESLGKLREQIEKMRDDIRDGVMAGFKDADISGMFAAELPKIIRELPGGKDALDKNTDLTSQIKWLNENNAKLARSLGGPDGLESRAGQMMLLHKRDSGEFTATAGYQDYRKMINMMDGLKKTLSNRTFGGGGEEKKEEKA